jgi:hypothetical protein
LLAVAPKPIIRAAVIAKRFFIRIDLFAFGSEGEIHLKGGTSA